MFCHLALLLGLLVGVEGLTLRGDGHLLGDDGVLTLFLRALAQLVGDPRLLQGLLTLFVRDLLLFVGDLLHLSAHASLYRRDPLLPTQLRQFGLQVVILHIRNIPTRKPRQRTDC